MSREGDGSGFADKSYLTLRLPFGRALDTYGVHPRLGARPISRRGAENAEGTAPMVAAQKVRCVTPIRECTLVHSRIGAEPWVGDGSAVAHPL